MEPLPIVKPIEYEEWLQDYYNAHPTIGDMNLVAALQEAMSVTCGRKAMRTWLSNHEPSTVEPTIAEHEDFLFEQLVKNPSIGSKAMMTAILKGRGVTFKEAPIRAWLAAHKGVLPTPIAEAASSSSGPSMALLQLSDMDQYADFLHRQLSETAGIWGCSIAR